MLDNLFNKSFNFRFKLANFIMGDRLRLFVGEVYSKTKSEYGLADLNLNIFRESWHREAKDIMFKKGK